MAAGAVLALIAAQLCFAQDRQAPPHSAQLDRALDELRELRQRNGKSPGVAEFFAVLRRAGVNQGAEVGEAWKAFAALQRPKVAKDAILQIVRAKRDSIDSIRAKCEFVRKEFKNGKLDYTLRETQEFASAGNKLLLSIKRPEAAGPWPREDNNVVAYDGEKVRRYRVPAGIGFGGIGFFQGRQQFIMTDANPLWAAMLADARLDMGIEMVGGDLVLFLDDPMAAVLDERASIRGHDCLVVSDATIEVALDPALNFAVVRFEQRLGGATSDWTGLVRDCDDFVDCGNGIWFPRQVATKQFERPNVPSREESLSLNDIQINEPLPDGFFTNVIPVGTTVSDGTKNLVYRMGEDSSIGELLDGAIPRPVFKTGSGIWKFTLACVCAVVAFTAVRMAYKWKRTARGPDQA